MNTTDIDILDNFAMWEFGTEPNLVGSSMDIHQIFRMNGGVLIHQTPKIQVSPTKQPLQTITNSVERTSLFDRKIQSPFQCLSLSSKQYAEISSTMSPVVIENKPEVFNCTINKKVPSNRCALPWSPIQVSQKSVGSSFCRKENVPDSMCSISADGRKHNKRRKTLEKSVPKEEAKKHPEETDANPMLVGSVLTKTDPKQWTQGEDKTLAIAVERQKAPPYNWKLIASEFFAGSRTANQCKLRWNKHHSKRGNIRGNWRPEEDEIILKLRSAGCFWHVIARHVPHRSHDQIRDRYNDKLDPSLVRTPWTEAEDKVLSEEQNRLGNKWSQIVLQLPGRSTNQVKNRWYQYHQRPPRTEKKTKSITVEQIKSPPVKRTRDDSLGPKVAENPWTMVEDNILIREQSRIGNKWKQISQLLPGRSDRQVSHRWHKYLRPEEDTNSPKKEKIPWTAEEDNILIQEHQRHGNQWKYIAQILPRRSASQVRCRWYKYAKTSPPAHQGEDKNTQEV